MEIEIRDWWPSLASSVALQVFDGPQRGVVALCNFDPRKARRGQPSSKENDTLVPHEPPMARFDVCVGAARYQDVPSSSPGRNTMWTSPAVCS